MRRIAKVLFIGLVGAALLAGCGGTDGENPDKKTMKLELSGVPHVDQNYQWEGWLGAGNGRKSTGKFKQRDGKSTYTFEVRRKLAQDAEKFILTLEPKPDHHDGQSDWKFLAANISDREGTAKFTTKPAAGAHLDGYFEDVSGKFFLNAPSSSNGDDNKRGIWFIDNSSGSRKAGLNIPKFRQGDNWRYEGWVVKNNPVTTGKFRKRSGHDSDKAGPFAGTTSDGHNFPGQDFVKDGKKRNLASGDYRAVISLEPNDDVRAPFAVKPLAGHIKSDTGVRKSVSLSNKIGTTPKVEVTLGGGDK